MAILCLLSVKGPYDGSCSAPPNLLYISLQSAQLDLRLGVHPDMVEGQAQVNIVFNPLILLIAVY